MRVGINWWAPILMIFDMTPKMPRYIFALCFIFLDVLRIMHRYLVGGECVLHRNHELLLLCLFYRRLQFKCRTYMFS